MSNIIEITKYVCNTCDKIFKQKIDYTRHINKKNKCNKVENMIEGKKTYKCENCNKVFSQKCNYMYHINRKNKCYNDIHLIQSNVEKYDLNIDLNENLNENLQSIQTISPQFPPQKVKMKFHHHKIK